MSQVSRLEQTWTALRQRHTEGAILYEKTLRPFMKSLNDGKGKRKVSWWSILNPNGQFAEQKCRTVCTTFPFVSHRKLPVVQHHVPSCPTTPVSAGEEHGAGWWGGAMGDGGGRGGCGDVSPGGGEDCRSAGGHLPHQRWEQTPR